MDEKYTILIAAGGTGGHIFPAIALARQYEKDGHKVIIVGTGKKIEQKIFSTEDFEIKYLKSNFKDSSIYKKLFLSFKTDQEIKSYVREAKPDLILGMGGYASAELCFARERDTCVIIHEQNSIAGRVNRLLLLFRASAAIQGLPGSFSWLDRLFMKFSDDLVFLGNPIRKQILNIRRDPNRRDNPKELRVFIMGGSQGARSINHVAPEALSRVNKTINIEVIHDAGEHDYSEVNAAYRKFKLNAKVTKFNPNIESAYEWADLFIGRAGAMTVSELSAIGLPSILIPYPYAMDNHQFHNANFLGDKGGAIIIEDKDLNPKKLAGEVFALCTNKRILEKMSRAALDNHFVDATNNITEFSYRIIKKYKLMRSLAKFDTGGV